MSERTYAPKARVGSTPTLQATFRPFGPAPAGGAPDAARVERLGHDFGRVGVAAAPIQRMMTGEEEEAEEHRRPRFEVPAGERARPMDFMQARAHVAARFFGATPEKLREEVDHGRKLVNARESVKAKRVGKKDADAVYDQTLAEDYVTLRRFQNEPEHNVPRNQHLSGFDHVREELHGGPSIRRESLRPRKGKDPEEPPAGGSLEHSTVAYQGARHTKGHNTHSSFVSLLHDPEKLVASKDSGPRGAQTIAQKAKQLHTYTVPKHFTWDTLRLESAMDPDMLHSAIDEIGTRTDEWLGSTPREEGEVLYLGNDLDRYRTGMETNPYLPKTGRPKTGRPKTGRKKR